MKKSRRTFMITTAGVASTLVLARLAFADSPKVSDSDATAQALGYRADATKVDKAKYAKYAAGQICSNCTLYQGKPSDTFAPCPMFGGKQVAGKGWCNAYSRKA
ncbi:high-potential iron-sulfur protein [Burkholderia lata]|uniref:High-potential iron-sulfur protein n=1 Tax=Burkholderia lata (strain ATCC 17760 / DSM 23089 / LMG 22485 / NCIMB 9086 / R18194 / 383) TaxID=482957 RepID=A0A6P2MI77_BURL3|nr:high-potential iron-sulfur protein [Burkholderia lata]VWB84997.1 high potential iron-sulfur protein [Burkholderia lata]